MRSYLVVCVLGCLLLSQTGCHAGGKRDLLERDLREEEDRIYELEESLDQVQSQLQCLQRENDALKRGLPVDSSTKPSTLLPSLRSPSTTPSTSTPRPGLFGPRRPNGLRGNRDETPTLEPPSVELGPPSSEPPASLERLPSTGRPSRLDGSFIPHSQPAKIVLDRELTGGLNHEGQPGDEGLRVAFEPRDAQGRQALVPGDVSIVVLDPHKKGEAARVARWDFTAEQVRARMKKSAPGDGLQFELPWPKEPPFGDDLRLYVRYTTPDRRHLMTDAHIAVNPLNVANAEGKGKTWSAVPPKALPPQDEAPKESPIAASTPAAPSTQLVSNDAPARHEPPAAAVASRPAPDDRTEDDAAARAKEKSIRDKPVWKPYR